ncbi:hypothetical protein WR25_00235 [Diploscapter pachys]|uniref:Uncharacterized protein n=1 Tax=Diploscapter pachys TaxID=2018661 RepID=A0A2A2M4E8_9BILA|nr:hypothetical protein WR25_00235 [Diploscapter pachys]
MRGSAVRSPASWCASGPLSPKSRRIWWSSPRSGRAGRKHHPAARRQQRRVQRHGRRRAIVDPIEHVLAAAPDRRQAGQELGPDGRRVDQPDVIERLSRQEGERHLQRPPPFAAAAPVGDELRGIVREGAGRRVAHGQQLPAGHRPLVVGVGELPLQGDAGDMLFARIEPFVVAARSACGRIPC